MALRPSERGVTLFEILLVLAILSLMVGAVSLSMGNMLPSLQLKQAAASLEADLKRARMTSRRQAGGVQVTWRETGYAIAPIDVEQEWAKGITLIWSEEASLVFVDGVPSIGGSVRLTYRGREMTLRVEPFTGRVHLVP
ncbi:MAG: prepilin-type N-terminal cleavage/methylation domain-containing protein [Pseudomonadota bacterium]